MNKVEKGSYVQIHRIVLQPGERSAQVPIDTKDVPLEMFVKGFLISDASVSDPVKIMTVTHRIEEGILIDIAPTFTHHFGDYVPELIILRRKIMEWVDGGDW